MAKKNFKKWPRKTLRKGENHFFSKGDIAIKDFEREIIIEFYFSKVLATVLSSSRMGRC